MRERFGIPGGDRRPLELRLPPEDGGSLVEYLRFPLDLGQPKNYYIHASNTDGSGRIIPYVPIRSRFLGADFESASTRTPRAYANRVMAHFGHFFQVLTGPEETGRNIEKMSKAVEKGEPIEVGMLYSFQKFPLADDKRDIKSGTTEPDLAELGFLHLLHSVNMAIKHGAYPPGVRFRILNEAGSFLRSPMTSAYDQADADAFQARIQSWIDHLGWNDSITVVDLLDECKKKDPKYLDRVEERFKTYLPYYWDKTPKSDPWVNAESSNVHVPSLEPSVDQQTLLRLYSGEPFTLAGARNMHPSSDAQPGDAALAERILQQARVQAAYFRAFVDARGDIGGVYGANEVPVRVTNAEGKIVIPTYYGPAQRKGPSRGMDVLPSSGAGVMTQRGIAIAPVAAFDESISLVHSRELGLTYATM